MHQGLSACKKISAWRYCTVAINLVPSLALLHTVCSIGSRFTSKPDHFAALVGKGHIGRYGVWTRYTLARPNPSFFVVVKQKGSAPMKSSPPSSLCRNALALLSAR